MTRPPWVGINRGRCPPSPNSRGGTEPLPSGHCRTAPERRVICTSKTSLAKATRLGVFADPHPYGRAVGVEEDLEMAPCERLLHRRRRKRRLRTSGERDRLGSWETSRGRAAPRRLASRQSRAVKPPQAALPEVVRALFSSSSSVDWTLGAAGVRNTLPLTTTSQPSQSVGPLPVACSERVSGSSVRPQRSPGAPSPASSFAWLVATRRGRGGRPQGTAGARRRATDARLAPVSGKTRQRRRGHRVPWMARLRRCRQQLVSRSRRRLFGT
jgi:hypothetical protein